MARKVYPDEVQARAVLLGLEYGQAEASRRTGIPAGTIGSWMSRGGVAIERAENQRAHIEAAALRWEERRMTMVERIGAVAEKALTATDEAIDQGETRIAKDAATTMAILVDKAQLLSGAATSRTETMVPIEAARALIDQVAERRTA